MMGRSASVTKDDVNAEGPVNEQGKSRDVPQFVIMESDDEDEEENPSSSVMERDSPPSQRRISPVNNMIPSGDDSTLAEGAADDELDLAGLESMLSEFESAIVEPNETDQSSAKSLSDDGHDSLGDEPGGEKPEEEAETLPPNDIDMLKDRKPTVSGLEDTTRGNDTVKDAVPKDEDLDDDSSMLTVDDSDRKDGDDADDSELLAINSKEGVTSYDADAGADNSQPPKGFLGQMTPMFQRSWRRRSNSDKDAMGDLSDRDGADSDLDERSVAKAKQSPNNVLRHITPPMFRKSWQQRGEEGEASPGNSRSNMIGRVAPPPIFQPPRTKSELRDIESGDEAMSDDDGDDIDAMLKTTSDTLDDNKLADEQKRNWSAPIFSRLRGKRLDEAAAEATENQMEPDTGNSNQATDAVLADDADKMGADAGLVLKEEDDFFARVEKIIDSDEPMMEDNSDSMQTIDDSDSKVDEAGASRESDLLAQGEIDVANDTGIGSVERQPPMGFLGQMTPIFHRSWRKSNNETDDKPSVPGVAMVDLSDRDGAEADVEEKATNAKQPPNILRHITPPLFRKSWRRGDGSEASPKKMMEQVAPPPIFQSSRNKAALHDIESGDEAFSDDDDDDIDAILEAASKLPDESDDDDKHKIDSTYVQKNNWGAPIFSRFRRNRLDASPSTADEKLDATDRDDEKSADEEQEGDINAPPPPDPPIEGVFVKDDVDSKIVVCSKHPDHMMAQRRPFCSGVRVYHWTCPLCLKQASNPQDFSFVVGNLLELYHRHYLEMEKSGVTQSRDLDRLQSELKNLKEEAGVARSMQELDMEYLDRLLVKTLPKMEMLWQDPPKKQEPILLGKLVSLRSDLNYIQEHVQKAAGLKVPNSNAVAAASLRDVIQQMIIVLNDDRVMELEESEQGELDAFTEEMMDWQDSLAVALVTIQNHLVLPETESDIEVLLVSLMAGEQAATATTMERDRLLQRRQNRFFRLPRLRRNAGRSTGDIE